MSQAHTITIPIEKGALEGNLVIPDNAKNIILFAHGSGSSRLSPRNQYVSQVLNQAGMATLLFDLLTKEEEQIEFITAEYRFDIELLTNRLLFATDWVIKNAKTRSLDIGYFGASSGAAAALIASGLRSKNVKAIVSRGGRPDLAPVSRLKEVQAPTLLIVGGKDDTVITMNEFAFNNLLCVKKLQIIPGATHLFEEAGTLKKVADAATKWFKKYLSDSTT
ncbi:MAG: dienelactone hydrolase family protein [Proteobacteria bacterium]|nr:dienelactone hydrolase family protein [Pseudomonadota bacterium]